MGAEEGGSRIEVEGVGEGKRLGDLESCQP